MIAIQPPQLPFHSPLSRSIDIPSTVALISPRSSFLSKENKLCASDFGRGIGSRSTLSLENIREEDGGEGIHSDITVASSCTSPSQLTLDTDTTPSSQESSIITVDAFNNCEASSSNSIPSILPIYDSKAPTSASRALNNRSGRFRKAISARSRYTGMPWVHASPHDLWQVVPSDSHPTIQRPPFSPIQPQTHSRRNASVLPEYPLPQVIARASESSAPKAIGSERKLRLLQQQREQPMVDVVPTPEWNSGSIPTSSSRHTGTFPSRQAKRFGAAQSQVSSLSQPVSGSIPERPKHRTIPLPPQGLPTPPPTPPSTPSSPHLPIHAPAPTPIRTSALPLIHLPPAPQAHSDYQQTQELIQKYKSISKFNAHRFRHGTKWTPVPRFSSGLNPAREALGEVLGAKGKDFVDGERWEKERERERERELELERLGLGLGSGSSLGFGRKEKSWNYFRRAQSVGLRSRSVCERSHSRSASGGCVSVSAYLRGSDQKHCLGCRREGLRVRLLIVQLWRRNLWEGGSSMSTTATATPILDSDLDFDLGMRLGLEFLGSEFEFDDDEDDDDEDDVDVNVVVVSENGGLGKRFVMDYWDDDSSQVGLGRVKERKGSEQTETNRDIPMDVDSETDSFSGPRRLDEELMRAQMEVDSDDHNQVIVKAPETVWVGGVPDSPRLKDLDDFDM